MLGKLTIAWIWMLGKTLGKTSAKMLGKLTIALNPRSWHVYLHDHQQDVLWWRLAVRVLLEVLRAVRGKMRSDRFLPLAFPVCGHSTLSSPTRRRSAGAGETDWQ